MDEVKAELDAEGILFRRDLPVGAMIEVPAAAIMADRLAKEVDFFSIGTNDLTQYTLAVDRTNENVADLYNAADPAVLRLIDMVVRAAERESIEVNVCGSMGGEPLHVMLLLGLGVRRLSMSPHQLPEIKRVIRGVSMSDARVVAIDALRQDTAEEVLAVLREAFDRCFENEPAPVDTRAKRNASRPPSQTKRTRSNEKTMSFIEQPNNRREHVPNEEPIRIEPNQDDRRATAEALNAGLAPAVDHTAETGRKGTGPPRWRRPRRRDFVSPNAATFAWWATKTSCASWSAAPPRSGADGQERRVQSPSQDRFSAGLGPGNRGPARGRRAGACRTARPRRTAEAFGGGKSAGTRLVGGRVGPPRRPPEWSPPVTNCRSPRNAAPSRAAAIDTFLAAERRPYTREKHNGDRSTIDLRPFVHEAGLDSTGTLRLRLRITPEGSARPDEVLDALALRDLLDNGTILVRTDVELALVNPTKAGAPLPDRETKADADSNADPHPNRLDPIITPSVNATERSPA